MLPTGTGDRNASKVLLDGLEAEDHLSYLVPDAVIHFFYVFVSVGAAANVYLIFLIIRKTYFKYLKRQKMEDTFIILLLIAACDLGSLTLVAPLEVRVLNYGCELSGLWNLSSGLCPFFLGMEVLFNTEIVYLLVIFALTIIDKMENRTSKSNKNVTVPVVLSWVLACSLSIPLFVRGQTVSPRVGLTLCTVTDQWSTIRGLFLLFRVVVPCLLLLTASVYISVRMCDLKREPMKYPRLLLALATVYGLLSLHRSVFTLLHVLLPRQTHDGPDAFKTPPLANIANSHLATLIFSMIHYAVSAVRPVIVFFFLKELWRWERPPVKRTERGAAATVVTSYNSEETLL